MTNSMYPYCDDCTLPFQSQEEKDLCGLHWRPQSGTKHGFPIDGWNCPKDAIPEEVHEDRTDRRKESEAQI